MLNPLSLSLSLSLSVSFCWSVSLTSRRIFRHKFASFPSDLKFSNYRNRRTISGMSALESMGKHDLVMDAFCLRQFNNPDYTGTQVHYDTEKFEKAVNDFYVKSGKKLVDGYAPFWYVKVNFDFLNSKVFIYISYHLTSFLLPQKPASMFLCQISHL